MRNRIQRMHATCCDVSTMQDCTLVVLSALRALQGVQVQEASVINVGARCAVAEAVFAVPAAPCNLSNSIPAVPVTNSPSTVFMPFTNRWGFFNYADSLVRFIHDHQHIRCLRICLGRARRAGKSCCLPTHTDGGFVNPSQPLRTILAASTALVTLQWGPSLT